MNINYASLGSVSHATLRSEDLIQAFSGELKRQISRNKEFFALPENKVNFKRLTALVCEAENVWLDNDLSIDQLDPEKEDLVEELVNETLPDALQMFCASYCYFGSHEGDGSDFGFWVSHIEDIKEQIEFVSSKGEEYPEDDYAGEWLHINERGNCTLYLV